MKILLLCFSILISAHISNFAQARLSAFSKMFVSELKKEESKTGLNKINTRLNAEFKKQFLVDEVNNRYFVSGFIVVDENLNIADLKKINVDINSKIKNIYNVRIPVSSLTGLSKVKGVKWIELGTPVYERLDSARILTKVNEVYEGVNLPHPYTGEGVIIGVIDNGFDYTHPFFFSDSSTLKISRVWEQNNENGLAPAGFSYGSEFIGQDDVLGAVHSPSATSGSHGSHVAGIAGGTGFLSDGRLRGIAPGAELVFVETSGSPSSISDAVSYIFSYAESVNKPAVINMSLGTHVGPHDGTSLLDQQFDQLAGPGKILVGAAGNEGSEKLHLVKEAGVDSIRTIVNFESQSKVGSGTVVLWGEANSSFSVRVSLFAGDKYLGSPLFSSASDGVNEFYFTNETDTLAGINIAMVSSAIHNQKPNILIRIENQAEASVLLTVVGSGEVDIWNHGEGSGAGLGDSEMPEFAMGDNRITVGEIGGTSKNVLTVGAYTSKRYFNNVLGETSAVIPAFFAEYGDIAPFSSLGPTIDLRTKPEITAPGNWVESAYSRFDEKRRDETTTGYLTYEETKWPLVISAGTSMATPVVTGVIALLLQQNPSLSRNDVINIFKKTSITDQFTGTIPDEGSNTWGFGKVDALAAMQNTITGVDNNEVIVNNYSISQNYPNPFNPVTNINYQIPVSGHVSLKVFDILGRELMQLVNQTQNAGNYHVSFDAGKLSSGVYIYKIQSGNFIQTKKMTLLK